MKEIENKLEKTNENSNVLNVNIKNIEECLKNTTNACNDFLCLKKQKHNKKNARNVDNYNFKKDILDFKTHLTNDFFDTIFDDYENDVLKNNNFIKDEMQHFDNCSDVTIDDFVNSSDTVDEYADFNFFQNSATLNNSKRIKTKHKAQANVIFHKIDKLEKDNEKKKKKSILVNSNVNDALKYYSLDVNETSKVYDSNSNINDIYCLSESNAINEFNDRLSVSSTMTNVTINEYEFDKSSNIVETGQTMSVKTKTKLIKQNYDLNANEAETKNSINKFTSKHNAKELSKFSFWLQIEEWSKVHVTIFNNLTKDEKDFKRARCNEFIEMNCDYVAKFENVTVHFLESKVINSMRKLKQNNKHRWLSKPKYLQKMHVKILKDLYLKVCKKQNVGYLHLLGCVIDLLSNFVKWAAKSNLLSNNVQQAILVLYIHCICPCTFISKSAKSLRPHLNVHLKSKHLDNIFNFYVNTKNPISKVLITNFKRELKRQKKI